MQLTYVGSEGRKGFEVFVLCVEMSGHQSEDGVRSHLQPWSRGGRGLFCHSDGR